MSAVPIPDPRFKASRIPLEGEVANPAAPPSGCYFHPRCPHANDQCAIETPQLEEISPGHWVSCLRTKEIDLAGLQASHGMS